jgi:hypothetical protein
MCINIHFVCKWGTSVASNVKKIEKGKRKKKKKIPCVL